MSTLSQIKTSLFRSLTNLASNREGNVSLLFGLTLMPMLAAGGAAVDYGRASNARTALQNAVDSTVLAMARRSPTLSDAQLKTEALKHFNAVLSDWHGANAPAAVVSRDKNMIRVEASGVVQAKFMGLLGQSSLAVATSGEAKFDQRRIEIALALDNTGSMSRNGKMDELKKATRNLIAAVEAAAPAGSGMIRVSLVPFDTGIKLDANTFRYNSAFAFNDMASDPSFDPIRARMSTKAAWAGCVIDRGNGFDGNDKRVDLSRPESLHPAVNCPNANLARVQPLTDNWAALRNTVSAMQPSGCTNIQIGARWGLASLSPNEPTGSGVPYGTPNVDKYLVILTDGNNTQHRFASNGCGATPTFGGGEAEIDRRTKTICNEIKGKSSRKDAAGKPIADVKVFTVRVIEGNQSLLRDCASRPDMYKEASSASEIDKVFKDILQEILALRLTM